MYLQHWYTSGIFLCWRVYCLHFSIRHSGSYQGLQCGLSSAITLASVFITNLGLQNCHHSRYPSGVCSIAIPEAYLYSEGCVVFSFQAHIRAYNNASSTVLLSRSGVLSPTDILEESASLLSPRHIWKVKGVLFSLFSLSLRLISGHTIMSPLQYSYLGLCIESLGKYYLGLQNCLHSRYPRCVCSIAIPEEGVLLSFFGSSVRLISVLTIMSPQQCSYLSLCIDSGELSPGPAELSSQLIS